MVPLDQLCFAFRFRFPHDAEKVAHTEITADCVTRAPVELCSAAGTVSQTLAYFGQGGARFRKRALFSLARRAPNDASSRREI